jgi:transposase
MAGSHRTFTSKPTKEVRMRGDAEETDAVFSYVSPAQRVPKDHPLRIVREITDAALKRLSRDFEGLYSKVGRPSVPPERLLRALLLQYFYGVRSERLLMEQLDYNLLFRWFVGLGMDDQVWDATTFTKNRERLLSGDLAQRFLEEIVAEARSRGLTSDEHFSVDGTMVQAWAGQKSFKKKDGPPEGGSGGGRERDFRGEKRSNQTHQSTTDPQARLYRKAHSAESKLSYLGHVVIENRNGLVVGCMATQATGRAEREAAVELMGNVPRARRATLAADKAYDARSFIAAMRAQGVTPHVTQNAYPGRPSAIDKRTTRHAGYGISQLWRKAIEHPFGWLKAAAGIRQVKMKGLALVGWVFTLGMVAYDLVRMRRLLCPA